MLRPLSTLLDVFGQLLDDLSKPACRETFEEYQVSTGGFGFLLLLDIVSQDEAPRWNSFIPEPCQHSRKPTANRAAIQEHQGRAALPDDLECRRKVFCLVDCPDQRHSLQDGPQSFAQRTRLAQDER